MEPKRKIGISSDNKEMHYSVGIILICNGKYLLMDRINPPPGFASPAGHIDEGEEPMEAAIRELKEETGIEKGNLEFVCEEEILWNYCKSIKGHYWYLYRALVDKEDMVIDKDEAKSMKWYTVEEIKEMQLEEVWSYWFKKLEII
ncbi:MAG: NUDIX hydrolase [Candidatus Paceibacterota bacterium]